LLVTLDGFFNRLLQCPVQFFEDLGHMRAMVGDTKFLFGDLYNSWTSPKIAAKPIRFGTMRNGVFLSKRLSGFYLYTIGHFF
jgi:hypothetical protein